MRHLNLLLTGLGRRVEIVQAFREAYRRLGFRGQIVGIDSSPLAPARHFVDVFRVGPKSSDPMYPDFLEEVLLSEEVSLVFPLIDPDIPILARLRARGTSPGVYFFVPSVELAEAGNDKWLTYILFQKVGLPTPTSWLPGSLPEDLDYPLVVKPRFGSASKGVSIVEDEVSLLRALRNTSHPLVQTYARGVEITTDVFCGPEGELYGFASRQRVEVRGGEVSKAKTIYVDAIARAVLTFCSQLKPVGPLNIQGFQDEEGKILFTEVNFRFGGGSPLSFASGLRAPEWYLEVAAGRKPNPPALGSYERGLYMLRYDQSVFLREEEL